MYPAHLFPSITLYLRLAFFPSPGPDFLAAFACGLLLGVMEAFHLVVNCSGFSYRILSSLLDCLRILRHPHAAREIVFFHSSFLLISFFLFVAPTKRSHPFTPP